MWAHQVLAVCIVVVRWRSELHCRWLQEERYWVANTTANLLHTKPGSLTRTVVRPKPGSLTHTFLTSNPASDRQGAALVIPRPHRHLSPLLCPPLSLHLCLPIQQTIRPLSPPLSPLFHLQSHLRMHQHSSPLVCQLPPPPLLPPHPQTHPQLYLRQVIHRHQSALPHFLSQHTTRRPSLSPIHLPFHFGPLHRPPP